MFLSYNVLCLYFIFSSLKFSNSATIFSPPGPSNFKNFAVISNFAVESSLDYTDIYEAECNFLDILVLEDHLRLCLLPYDISENRLIQNMSIILPQSNFAAKEFYALNDFSVQFVRGYILEKPYTSSLSGFMINKYFFGKVETEKHTYYIEPLTKYKTISRNYDNPEQRAIFYEAEDIDVKYNINNDMMVEDYEDKWESYYQEKKPERSQIEKVELWKGHCCSLLVLVDYTFYKEMTNSSVNNTIMSVIHSLLFANSVFGTTDFDDDGEPDDIGFYIKYLAILDSVEYHNKYFKHETVHAVEAKKYLEMFSKYELLSEVCLGILLTAQPFIDNKISYSYIFADAKRKLKNKLEYGAACKTNSYNSLVVTNYIDYGDYIPVFIADLALLHELGHALGSSHDGDECWGYVMSSKMQLTANKYHFTFSNCSKSAMLKYIKERSYCFENWSEESHCGNGLIERGEECDCGLSYDCNNEHFCCVPSNGKDKPCHIDRKSGFDCVPSQGFCCNKDCQFIDLSLYQIDCKNENRRCPCEEKSSFCTCGHSGICLDNYCHSRECVYSGLLECVCELRKTMHCETCCLSPEGLCLPLSEIDEVYVNESNSLLRSMKNVQHIPYETLGHRIWQNNEICVSFGRTGYCQHGICDLEAPTIVLKGISEMVDDYKDQYIKENVFNDTSTKFRSKSKMSLKVKPKTSQYASDSAIFIHSFVAMHHYLLLLFICFYIIIN